MMNRIGSILAVGSLALMSSCVGGSVTTGDDNDVAVRDRIESDLAAIPQYNHKRVCADPAPGQAACHAHVRTDANGVVPYATTPQGYGPADIQSAYKLDATAGANATVAIVDAQDDQNAEADLGVYRSTYGLAACTTTNGCFKKVNES